MKKITILVLTAFFLMISVSSCTKKEKESEYADKTYVMSSKERKESYVFGNDIAKMIRLSPDYKTDFSSSAFLKAYKDLFKEKTIPVDIFAVRKAFEVRDSIHIRVNLIKIDEIPDSIERYSYIYGIFNADLAYLFYESFDLKAFLRGFNDEFNDLPLLFTEAEVNVIKERSRKEISEFRKTGDPSLSPDERKRINEKFLEVNAKRESVKVLPSGLQYLIISEGNGLKPESDNERLKVNYRAMFIDGRIFYDTYLKNDHAEFEIGKVIPGWSEGLKLMNEGSKYKFFIPPELAYGEKGLGDIPPNSTLIYEVELIEIIKLDENLNKPEEK